MGSAVFLRASWILFLAILVHADESDLIHKTVEDDSSCPSESCEPRVKECDKKQGCFIFKNDDIGFSIDDEKEALEREEWGHPTVRQIQPDSQADKVHILPGMKVKKICEQVIYSPVDVANSFRRLKNCRAENPQIAIWFDTSTATVKPADMVIRTMKDGRIIKGKYRQCVEQMENIESIGQFDYAQLERDTKTELYNKITAVDEEVFRGPKGNGMKNKEKFKEVIRKVFFHPDLTKTEDFFFGAHDACQIMMQVHNGQEFPNPLWVLDPVDPDQQEAPDDDEDL